jgi:hypothetical protein
MKSALRILGAVGALQLALASQVAAVTIGADAFGYTATNTVPYAFNDIHGTGSQLLGSNVDDYTSPVAIGFAFSF